MPNDAKLGLLVGVVIVLGVAVVFFQKEPALPVATIQGPTSPPPVQKPGSLVRPIDDPSESTPIILPVSRERAKEVDPLRGIDR